MKSPLSFGLMMLGFCVGLFAQNLEPLPHRCASTSYTAKIAKEFPEFERNQAEIERHTQRYLNDGVAIRQVITIPVVVHVVYANNTQNVSQAQIQSQLNVINADFRRRNSDANNTRNQFVGVAADPEFEFCLATVDPSGSPTNGVTRTSTTVQGFDTDDDVKFASTGGHDAWPRDRYLNMWVCDLSGANVGSGQILLGYAAFPGGPASRDGVVINYQYFGTIGTAGFNNDNGRTTTHEIGHWLNLRHIWGDGPCTQDDFVNDTPPSDAANFGCAQNHFSCNSLDMVENFMDYSSGSCTNMFTTGQKNRMRALFAPGGARAALANSTACGNNPAPCAGPTNLQTLNITTTTADLQWAPASGAQSYEVRVRQVGTTNWVTGSANNSSIQVTGLSSCLNVEWQVRTVCAGGNSPFTASSVFTTAGCTGNQCSMPANLQAQNITPQDAELQWNTVSGAQSYNVRARAVGATSWNSANITGTVASYTGLTACTDYEFQVEALCSNGNSGFSPSQVFTTGGCQQQCGQVLGLQALNIRNDTAELVWNPVNGAVDYNIRAREVGVQNWTTGTSSGTAAIYFGLDPCTDYEFEVQANCGNNNLGPFSTNANFTSAGCANVCRAPNILSVSNIQPTEVQLNWVMADNAVSYNIRARQMGATQWITGSFNQTAARYFNLTPCSQYEFQVQTVCTNDMSDFSASELFVSGGCSVPVEAELDGETYRIAPNPFDREVFVTAARSPARPVHYELYDLTGRMLRAGTTRFAEGRARIALPDVPAGAYVLRFATETELPVTFRLLRR